MKKILTILVIGLLLMPNTAFALTEGKKAADQLREIAVTSGVGLYADEFEQGRYVYKGTISDQFENYSANNWIKFNGELWYIIAVEADDILKIVLPPVRLPRGIPEPHEKATPGKKPAREAIITGEDKPFVSEMNHQLLASVTFPTMFDPGYGSNIPGVTESGSIVGTRGSTNPNDYCYANRFEDGDPYVYYQGCNVWGSNTTTLNSAGTSAVTQYNGKNLPSEEAYINTFLNGEYYNSIGSDKEYIVEHLFNVGWIDYDSTITQALQEDKANKWLGKVGLLSMSDFVKSCNEGVCTNFSNGIMSCLTGYDNASYLVGDDTASYLVGATTLINPMNPGNDWLGLGEYFSYYGLNYIVNNPGYTYSSRDMLMRPALYLTDCITLTGVGTFDEPYKINDFECSIDEPNNTPDKTETVKVPATDAFIPLIISSVALLLIITGITGYYFINKRKQFSRVN